MGVYVASGVFFQLAQTGDGKGECAREFLGVG